MQITDENGNRKYSWCQTCKDSYYTDALYKTLYSVLTTDPQYAGIRVDQFAVRVNSNRKQSTCTITVRDLVPDAFQRETLESVIHSAIREVYDEDTITVIWKEE